MLRISDVSGGKVAT